MQMFITLYTDTVVALPMVLLPNSETALNILMTSLFGKFQLLNLIGVFFVLGV
jgi:hypothetical protein